MKKIKLEIVGLSYSQSQSGAYALVLGEVDGNRRLPVIIGGFEAQAIAIEIEKMKPSRPLTHDLFKSLANSFSIEIQEVVIYNLIDGVFFATLLCKQGDKVIEIDARTSDAIALSVRFNCPVYTYEFIIASAGVILEGEDFVFLENIDTPSRGETSPSSSENVEPLAPYSNEELKEKLKQALAEEAYERAAKIRDELNKRKAS